MKRPTLSLPRPLDAYRASRWSNGWMAYVTMATNPNGPRVQMRRILDASRPGVVVCKPKRSR